MKTWPTLYRRTSTGAIQQWKVWTEDDTIWTEYGQVNGAMQRTSKKAEPKNVGRANATSAERQAELEAQAMWTKRADLKYTPDIDKAQTAEPVLPMLAHNFEDQKARLQYPVFVQPKLDGVRCLAYRDDDGQVVLSSRQGKPWNLPHVAAEVAKILPVGSTDVLDGEIYLHGVTFQSVTRMVKKHRPETTSLKYMIYDVITDQAFTQSERINYLKGLFRGHEFDTLMLVPTEVANTEIEVYNIQKNYVSGGYEGAIVRKPHAPYKMNARSNDLLKVKSFLEEDFKIVGYKQGVGRFAGLVIWVCETAEGKTFDCVPKGSMEDKAEWFANADKYVGKLLSVKFFEYTEDGIPRFPVGLGIKEDR